MFVVKKPPKRSSNAQWLTLVAAMCLLAVVSLIAFRHNSKMGQDKHESESISLSLSPSSSHVSSASPERTALCNPTSFKNHTDLDGYVVVAGNGPDPGTVSDGQPPEVGLHTRTAVECCHKCAYHKGCNVFVFGEEQKQCWLKRADKEKDVQSRGSGPMVPWTSGVLDKDWSHDWNELPPASTAISHVVLKTSHGEIRIRLMEEWSETSVQYVRLLAANSLCSSECKLYRAEPGFLLQGVIRGFLPSNKVTKEGPKIMERGDIGWAGGSFGPDFFIYIGAAPATHFGKTHTVWGVVDGEASMAVVEKIVMLPAKSEVPGGMHMLVERTPIDVQPTS